MAHPSQSQDVEHTGPKSNPLDPRRRPSPGSSQKPVRDEPDHEAQSGPQQRESDNSKHS
jgi:hypothetical protein